MADDGFNGTTATFAEAELGGGLRGVRYNESVAKVDTSAAGEHRFAYSQYGRQKD